MLSSPKGMSGPARPVPLVTVAVSARRRRSRRSVASVALVLTTTLTMLVGCTPGGSPSPNQPTGSGTAVGAESPEQAAATLAQAISARDVSTVSFVDLPSADADTKFQGLIEGMGPRKPTVSVGPITTEDEVATVTLQYSWPFPGIEKPWTYNTTAELNESGGRWLTVWQPAILQPGLTEANRLTQRRQAAERGDLLGSDGEPIMELRPVVRLGIDKSKVTAAEAATSAAALANLVKVDAKAYAAKVKASGAEAFVEAITYRATDKGRPATAAVRAIKGGVDIEDDLMLAPTRDFARSVIGTVGEATEEIVKESKGAVVAGDQVGLSGLQRRYDAQLRGAPGVTVRLVAAKTPDPSGSSASPSPSAAESSGPIQAVEPVTVFEAKAVTGKSLETSLNIVLQQIAEEILGKQKQPASLVAIRPSTGQLLAVANSAQTDGKALATTGHFAPGSTFKVASSLALLRAGVKPSSSVKCPASLTVDGKKFTNYSDYPSSAEGTIDLRTAFARSCNTAFIGERGKLKGTALAEAAGSLGLGVDYDTGFASYFGGVPADKSSTGQAAALIGQGQVTASPMTMAAVASSVQAGKTVIPWLVKGQQARPTAKPLTKAEADQLKQLMRGVVETGSGRFLAGESGQPIIAKTGTAEFGNKLPLQTHAWMIGAQGDLAVAVFIQEGKSGSSAAGPLLKDFLARAR